ncbi:ATP-dependent DNA helicase RecQ [Asanoa hainanensis]|uniref:ATP-dependent DNA helicase RecQ n=1 Tax=Asanoa hainanensis TaxID=560556 RepID=A0A239PEX3_9ACTN|nr:ATP-dependent DNA helicase RecQ [Asanoa hainanensis]SNT65590.1 ATP-dependent DNA helicase RecQ [Asanoa hainanensis]
MRPTFTALRLRRAARTLFGWKTLRPGQLDAMRAILRGHDVLAVMPTGAGKSALYQVPATQLPGPTVVISPLLALQQDQIGGLERRGAAPLKAVRVSSAETPKQQQAALAALRDGSAEFLFITPEQLADPDRLAEVKACKPSLVAVDEAHCISAWGHDFRPDYLALGHVIRQLGRPPVVALTATASPPVRDDIVERLGLRKPKIMVTGLDRHNLFLEAANCPTEDYRWRRLQALLAEGETPGIVYVPTRRGAEELATRLRAAGHEAAHYHGGMATGAREKLHEEFLADKVPIMVATSAFGMGIDKPNIRWVAHVALPDSPDSYLQEIGRAGRDGLPARTLLLWRAEDEGLQRFFTGALPALDELRDLAAVLRADGPFTKTALRERTGFGARKLGQLVALLEHVGGAVTRSGGKIGTPRYAPQPADAAALAVAEAERQQNLSKSRTDMMRGYAEARGCRGQALLAYFGEKMNHVCGHCDNCVAGRAVADNGAVGPFPVHSTVKHAEWGSGMVMGYEDDKMTVLFDEVGYKTLSVPVVSEQGLLVADPR